MSPKSDSELTNANDVMHELVEQYMVPLDRMITFKPDQPIQEVISIIIDKKISGAPVLDDQKHLVGIISEKDCLRLIVDQAYHNLPAETRKVSDYMTVNVKSMTPKTTVVDAAMEFLNSPIRRFAVVDSEGRLLGQVSRRDILSASQKII